MKTYQVCKFNAELHLNQVPELISNNDFVKMDILKCLDLNPDCAWVVALESTLAGIGVFSGAGEKASYTLFVRESLRRQGIGTALLNALEEHMKAVGVKEAVCDYMSEPVIDRFVSNKGYENWFRSRLMIYKGDILELNEAHMTAGNLEIVPYQDYFYPESQRIFSEAFHGMRLSVGLPSVLSQPSEDERARYIENAENLFVLRAAGKQVAVVRLEAPEIDALAVDPACHRSGFGQILAIFAVNELMRRGHKEVSLWAVEGNPARFLYEKVGFESLRVHQFCQKKL